MTIKPNFILTCDQAFLTSGTNNLNCIGIFTTINAETFPLTYRHFALVVNFDTDSLKMHTLTTRVLNEAGHELVKSDLRISISSSPFQVIANFENLVFPTPGKYELNVMLDGQPVGSRTLQVNQLPAAKTNVA